VERRVAPAKTMDTKNIALPAVGQIPERGDNARRGAQPRGELPGVDTDTAMAQKALVPVSTPLRSGKASGVSSKSRRRPDAPTTGPRLAPGPGLTGQIGQLKEMGFSEEQSRQALAECVWDLNKALDLLFTRCGVTGNSPRAGGAADETDAVDSNAGVTIPAVRVAEKVPASPRLRLVASNAGTSPVAGDSAAESSTTASTTSTPRSTRGAQKTENASASLPTRLPFSSSAVYSEVLARDASVGRTLSSIPASTVISIEVVTKEKPEVPTIVAHTEAIPDLVTTADLMPTTELGATNVDQLQALTEEGSVEAPAPKKRIERCLHSCPDDGESIKLACDKGEFLRVWTGSETEHGWVYAELLNDSARAGWLPTCALQNLGSEQRWMQTLEPVDSVHDAQIDVKRGTVLNVSLDSRTNEGWVYAELASTGDVGADGENGCVHVAQAGWVPWSCLEWTEE